MMPLAYKVVGGDLRSTYAPPGKHQYQIGNLVEAPEGIWAYPTLEPAVKRWRWARSINREGKRDARILELAYDDENIACDFGSFGSGQPLRDPSKAIVLTRCTVTRDVTLQETVETP